MENGSGQSSQSDRDCREREIDCTVVEAFRKLKIRCTPALTSNWLLETPAELIIRDRPDLNQTKGQSILVFAPKTRFHRFKIS